MSCFDSHTHALPGFGGGCDDFSPFSSPSKCPSMSASFLTVDTSSLEGSDHRKSSPASASPDLFSSASTTSPTTPLDFGNFIPANIEFAKALPAYNYQPVYAFSRDIFSEDEFWANSDGSKMALLHHYSEIPASDVQNGHHHTLGDADYAVFSHGMSNPALSRPIFDSVAQTPVMTQSEEDMYPWSTVPLQQQPQTVAPCATFQAMLSSSPAAKPEPATPLRSYPGPSVVLSSSPLPILPSQHEVDDLTFDTAEQLSMLNQDFARRRRTASRLARRSYERKDPLGSSKSKLLSSKSGIDCDVVIAQNEFACGYSGCIDKNTGKQKRFKRQEHKKRHEKTVHERHKHGAYKCWVPQCKTPAFTRTDNLKSHLKNTHGKKSANARNRYVATQDKNSEYYDPEWVGDLSPDGYPMR